MYGSSLNILHVNTAGIEAGRTVLLGRNDHADAAVCLWTEAKRQPRQPIGQPRRDGRILS